jgi:isopentenyl-diphosphate delta-isomerase
MNDKLEIVLVDENDQEIWIWEKMDVHQKWLLHRAISVLIINSRWEMLVQQRAMWKYHCPWLWSNATCTHPYPNESSIDAAHRRLQEEMWFDTDLEEIFQFRYTAQFDNWLTENEYDHVFFWYYDEEIDLNLDEVADYKWIWIEELKKDIVENSKSYTQWFKIILEKYFFNLN